MADFKNKVVYQIYPKSFKDSNGDGIGDLRGVIDALDYLADMGVDYLWLTPFFVSPQKDNGYDIADYLAIDPHFGTRDDFDALVKAANAKGLKIMLDMVLCHTSDQHAWFQQALAGDADYQRYYILRDGRNKTCADDPGEPPTNWQCAFGGSAWQWEPRLGKWYLHLHDVSQPDLDWTNPTVRDELAKVVRFWKERGVAGFRFDVINLVAKPEVFADDTQGLGRRLFADGPHIHEYLQELVHSAGIGDMVTVDEMASTDLENCIHYTRPANHELSMTFSFHHLKIDYKDGDKWALMPPDMMRLKQLFAAWQTGMAKAGGWNALFWCNHDQPRIVSRLGDDKEYREASAKMLAACIHLMRGTPYIYQGGRAGHDQRGLYLHRGLPGRGESELLPHPAGAGQNGGGGADDPSRALPRQRTYADAVVRRAVRRFFHERALDSAGEKSRDDPCGGGAEGRGFHSGVLSAPNPAAP